MSDIYMLKNVGERTPSWVTSVFNWRYVDVCMLFVLLRCVCRRFLVTLCMLLYRNPCSCPELQ